MSNISGKVALDMDRWSENFLFAMQEFERHGIGLSVDQKLLVRSIHGDAEAALEYLHRRQQNHHFSDMHINTTPEKFKEIVESILTKLSSKSRGSNG